MNVPKWFYTSLAWKARRAAQLEAFPACRKCGSTEKCHVHHDANPEEYRKSISSFLTTALITLCPSCHSDLHKSNPCRRAWKTFSTEALSHDGP